jgi:uncharacterized protein (DUF983 family)
LTKQGSKIVKVFAVILIIFFVSLGIFMVVEREWEATAGAMLCTVIPAYYLVTRR